MNQLDSINNDCIVNILKTTDEICQNTDPTSFPAWLITFLSALSAVATIIGLFMVYIEIGKRHYTKQRQTQLIKDLIRHLFANSAVLEILERKTEGKWDEYYPAEAFFSRFCFLDDDLKLGDISVNDSQFEKLHSLRLRLRNYNLSAKIASQNFMSRETPISEKDAEIKELRKRANDIVNSLVELGRVTHLLNRDAWKDVSDYIIEYYSKKYEKEYKEIKDEELPEISDKGLVFDKHGLKDTFAKLVIIRKEEVRIIEF